MLSATVRADVGTQTGERKLNTRQAIKNRVVREIEELPLEGLQAIARYVDDLKSKLQVEAPRQAVALGGLWKDLGFNVTGADVRSLRQQVTDQLLSEV